MTNPASPPPSPTTLYRVSAKALIFDDEGRLLVFKDSNGEWEMPGGGLEHDESFDECLRREFEDEVGVTLSSVGEIEFFWRDYADDARGYRLRLAAKATLASTKLKPKGDDGEILVETRFVSRDEFLRLPFQESEKGVLSQVNSIWPS